MSVISDIVKRISYSSRWTVLSLLREGEGEFHVVTDNEEFMQKVVALLHEKG